MGVQNHRESVGRESSSGVQGSCNVAFALYSLTLHRYQSVTLISADVLARSRAGALVGGLGDKVPQKLKNFKVVTSKCYAFLAVIHTQYMKSKHDY